MSEEESKDQGETLEVPEPSMEELFEAQVKMDEVKQAEKDLLLPVATYTTVPALQVKKGVSDNGRPYVRFFGPIQTVIEATGEEIKANIGFTFSHVRKNRLDKDGEDTGKPDNMTKLYTNAVSAYKKAYSENPSTVNDVINYIRDYPVRVRVIQIGVPTKNSPDPTGEAGNMVVALSAPLA